MYLVLSTIYSHDIWSGLLLKTENNIRFLKYILLGPEQKHTEIARDKTRINIIYLFAM